MEITGYAIVKNQSLAYHSYGKLQTELTAFEGKEVEISIRKKKNYRSSPQNRYYWGAVIPSLKYAMESKGFIISSKDQIHELMKYKFLKGEIINASDGEIMETLGSTTNLSRVDFMNYIEQIKAWAATYLDCLIPEPSEQLTIN